MSEKRVGSNAAPPAFARSNNVLRTSTGPMGPPAPPLISSEFRFVLLPSRNQSERSVLRTSDAQV
jgi:hypothetical protein